jgi:hypothetical protein
MKSAAVGSGVAGFLVANAAELRANPLGLPIGSQVYPLRSMLKDFPAFAKMMAAIGVTRLELCSPIGYGPDFAALASGKTVRKILADQGMKAESSHFSMSELRNSQQKSIEWANEVGITQMITATLGEGNGGNHPTLDQVKSAADEYNKIAAVAATAGIQQGLHNEGFELSMVDGKRTYDLLFDLLDPKLVKFQFQMSTITAARRAPPAGRGGPRHHRLGEDLHRRENRRGEELLCRAELGTHEAECRVSQDPGGLIGENGTRPAFPLQGLE